MLEPFPYRQNQTKFLIVLISMFSLAICSLWGWIKVNEIATTKVQKMVSKLKNKSGIPVHIGHWRIGFGGAHFEDIVVGPNSEVVISEVSADLNLNPFSDYFGQLRHITIHRIQIKTDLERIASTRRQLTQKTSGPQKSQTPIEKLMRLIPVQRSLTIGSGNLRLINNDGEVIGAARGLKLRIDKKLKKIDFAASAIKTLNGSIERNLSGNLTYDRFAGKYNFLLQQKVPNATNVIQGQMNKGWSEIDLTFNLKFAPQNFKHILEEKGVDLNKFNLEGRMTGTQEKNSWRYQLRAKGRSLNFKHKLIANHRIGPLPFALNGHGLIEPHLGKFTLTNGTLHLPVRKGKKLYRKVLIGLDFNVERQKDQSLKASGRVQLPRTNCQDILEVSPKGLTPNLTSFKLAGQVQANLTFDFSSDNLANFSYRIRQKHFGCSVVAMPYTYSAKHLRGPFSLEREVGKDDQPLEITLTPMSQGFSEFDAISPNVPIAFITSEDAGFWSHEGIDTFSIENAIRKNLEERRVTIGGSTITMQTVKNLFLSHRRTISRKLQELFLAWHIENVVDKQRILEIYMNIAEFGPGIYGVTNAAEHYFGKHPFDLNLKESAFLAALLPSPKRRYRHFCNGRPTEEFKEIVDSVLTRVLKLGKIEFGRYQRAKSSELEFNAESRLKSSACARLALSDADRDEDLR